MPWLLRLALILTCLIATPAHAAWVKAETERFIVYGDAWEGEVRAFAVKLTTFDAILRIYHPSTAATPPGRKLPVFLVRDFQSLTRVRPDAGSGHRLRAANRTFAPAS